MPEKTSTDRLVVNNIATPRVFARKPKP